MRYKNITISKISDHNGLEKTPTHAIKVALEGSKYLIVGKLWTKTGQYGKFLSGVMANEFKGEKGTFPGYCIVEDKYIQALEDKIKNLDTYERKSLSKEEVDLLENARKQDTPRSIENPNESIPF